MGEVLTFVSGKGGTGKTALCAALATILAKSGRRVLCIDGDVGLRNLDVFLGLAQTEALSFLEVCRGDYPLSAALVHPKYPCLSFLTAPANGDATHISADLMQHMLCTARQQFEFIFIDGPAGIGPGMSTLAKLADRSVLVTLPDPASIRNAERAAQELEKLGCSSRLVVNRVYGELLKAMNMNIDDIMDAVGLPLLGVVPSDPNVNFAAAKNLPILQYSRQGACAAYRRIAKRIQGQPVPVSYR